MPNRVIPGTSLEYANEGGMFDMLRPLIKATDGLTLSQVCAVTNLEPFIIQNWVKRGFVAHPLNKKYRERQLARILLISSLRESMRLETIGELMALINGSADDENDDIISEEALYDNFCAVIMRVSENAFRLDETEKLIDSQLKNYKSNKKDAKKRLKDALAVMVYAYCASEYKKLAEKSFNEMKEIYNEK